MEVQQVQRLHVQSLIWDLKSWSNFDEWDITEFQSLLEMIYRQTLPAKSEF